MYYKFFIYLQNKLLTKVGDKTKVRKQLRFFKAGRQDSSKLIFAIIRLAFF